ncbi:MAG TPA: hypothetical protein VI457_04755 [Methylococcaceae bacterium]|nr:hypothetical protein [Methylococcaceae bacterium]
MQNSKRLCVFALFAFCVLFGTPSQAAILVWAGADHTRQDGWSYHEGLGGGEADADSIEGFIDALQVAKGVADLAKAIVQKNPLDAGIAIHDIVNEAGQLNDSLGDRSFSYEGSILVDVRNDRRVELKIEGESNQDDFRGVEFLVPDGPVGAFQGSYDNIFPGGNQKKVIRSLYIDPSKLKAGMHYPVVAITKERGDITSLSVVWTIDVVAGAQCPRPPSDPIQMCFQTTTHLKELRAARQENRLARARAIAHDPSLVYETRAKQAANTCAKSGNCAPLGNLGPNRSEDACPQIYTGLARTTCSTIAQLDRNVVDIDRQILDWENKARENNCCDAYVNPFGNNVPNHPLTIATNATFGGSRLEGVDWVPYTVSRVPLLNNVLFGTQQVKLFKDQAGAYVVNGQSYESMSIHTDIAAANTADIRVTARWGDADTGLPIPEVRTGMQGVFGKKAYVNVPIQPAQFPMGRHLLVVEVTDHGNQVAQHSIEIARTIEMMGGARGGGAGVSPTADGRTGPNAGLPRLYPLARPQIAPTVAPSADGSRSAPPVAPAVSDLPVFNAVPLQPRSGPTPSDSNLHLALPGNTGVPLANISGQWNSNIGLVYSIEQQGAEFRWHVANIDQTGKGTIEGDRIRATWSDRNGTGSGNGVIREKDSLGGAHRIEWDNGVVFTK